MKGFSNEKFNLIKEIYIYYDEKRLNDLFKRNKRKSI